MCTCNYYYILKNYDKSENKRLQNGIKGNRIINSFAQCGKKKPFFPENLT